MILLLKFEMTKPSDFLKNLIWSECISPYPPELIFQSPLKLQNALKAE